MDNIVEGKFRIIEDNKPQPKPKEETPWRPPLQIDPVVGYTRKFWTPFAEELFWSVVGTLVLTWLIALCTCLPLAVLAIGSMWCGVGVACLVGLLAGMIREDRRVGRKPKWGIRP